MDYNKLIKEMEMTGAPVSSRIDTDGTVTHLDGIRTPVAHQIIDTTATPAPVWSNVPALVTFHPPQEESYAPTRRHIFQRLESRRKAALPVCISTRTAALLYEGLVNFALLFQTHRDRLETITRALGGDFFDVKKWKFPQPDDNFICWASQRLNATPLVAALALGDVIGMKPEYVFGRFPASPDTPAKTRLAKQPFAFPKQLAVYGTVFYCTAVDVLRDYSHDDLQYEVKYTSAYGDVLVFANRETAPDGKDVFRIGFRPPDVILPSRELMATEPNATVIFCLAPDITIRLRQIARESRLLDRANVIVTGLYGGQSEADAIDLTPLTYRDVVIIAFPGQASWALVEQVAKRCKAKRPNSLMLYPWALLYHGLRLDPTGIPDIAKKHIEEHAVFFDDDERPSLLMQRIVKASINIDGLAQWKSSIGLTASTKRSGEDTDGIDLSGFKKFKELPDIPLRKAGDPISLRQFFNSNDITLIWAPSDAGKSLFIQDIVLRMVTGDRFFFFDADEPCSIVVLDGEVGDYYKARAKQLVQSRCISNDLIDENLTVKYCRGESLLSPYYQKIVMSAIKRDNAQVLVIDNLNSNAPEDVDGNTTKLLDYLGVVANNGVSIIMIHHSTKEGDKFFGRHSLLTRSQNVIRLYNREQIRELEKEEDGFCIPHEVQSMMDDKASAVMLLEVTKCKVAPDLANRRHFFVLPYGGEWGMVDHDQPKPSSASDSEDDGPQIRLQCKTPMLPGDIPCVAIAPQNDPSVPSLDHPSTEDDASASNDEQNGSDEMLAPVTSEDEVALPEEKPHDGDELWHGKLPSCPLTPEADAVLHMMRRGIAYTRANLQGLVSKDYRPKDIRLAMKMLAEADLVNIEGKGKGTRYSLK